MPTNILFTGRAYYSLENCLVNDTGNGMEITSVIIGLYEERIYRVDYHILTNPHWETGRVEITCRHGNTTDTLRLESEGKGNWLLNGLAAPQFDGCMDIDVPLTPFTNTLPIRKLNLHDGQSQEIQVIYCDLLNRTTGCVRQQYTRLSATRYHYQNVPNDFEATITVDEQGLVVDYPGLFVRTAVLRGS
ncbi:MAG TPA: putative glycolipid-binding domain-containing protein [Bacteroidia bacterium]|nr:putative glycolipid-binding domain-containing protein [Bacteroidia bacterium]